jgi:hypothetical protein
VDYVGKVFGNVENAENAEESHPAAPFSLRTLPRSACRKAHPLSQIGPLAKAGPGSYYITYLQYNIFIYTKDRLA